MTVDANALRELLLDDASRADLFPRIDTEFRSRPTSKVVQLAIGPTAQIAVDLKGNGKVRVEVSHERLPSADEAEWWRQSWAEWLAAIDEP